MVVGIPMFLTVAIFLFIGKFFGCWEFSFPYTSCLGAYASSWLILYLVLFLHFSLAFSQENWLVWMGMWTIFGQVGDSTFSIGTKWICVIDLTSLSIDLQVNKNCNQSCGTLIFILKLEHSNSQHYGKEFSRMSFIIWACN